MYAWINLALLIFSSIMFLLFYVRSVSPAGRALLIGTRAYRLCYYDRLVSGVLEFVIMAAYILYRFYPLPVPMAENFPWPWWLSITLAALIGVPATVLMLKGLRDAGEEALQPKPEHNMYSGIYTHMRHPQAVGEVFLFAVIGLLLNSPFLTLYSLIFFPIFILLCYAEEEDLLLRYGKDYADYCGRTGAFWPKKERG